MRGSLLGHTVESMQIPQFTSMVEADASGLLEARAAVAAETGSRAPLDALLVLVLAGTPLLPLGTSMIAAFGTARPVVQIRNGVAVEVPTMTVSATFDHRIIDGRASGRFLAQLKDTIEAAANLLI